MSYCAFSSNAQIDYSWWNNNVNWDGVTHWHKYIILSPGFMGPNALPVPEVKTGKNPDSSYVDFAIEHHQITGDQTQNIYTEFYIPLYTPRVGLRLSMVPLEYYQMDTIIRDLRRARNRDGSGIAGGDLYFSTYIQLIEQDKKFPDLLLTLNFKTASGSKLSSARYTDAPAYFFDISAGKSLKVNNFKLLKTWRPFVQIGFFAWQTFDDAYFQNDALVYGGGVELQGRQWRLKQSFGGYKGYIGNGDQSAVYRFELSSSRSKKMDYTLRLQQGFQDFNYSSLRISARRYLSFKL